MTMCWSVYIVTHIRNYKNREKACRMVDLFKEMNESIHLAHTSTYQTDRSKKKTMMKNVKGEKQS